jgi:tetratricopeptide (TPR) repeat protein
MQKTENRRQKTEDRRRKTEDRRQNPVSCLLSPVFCLACCLLVLFVGKVPACNGVEALQSSQSSSSKSESAIRNSTKDKEQQGGKAKLQDLIEQIHSIKLEQEKRISEGSRKVVRQPATPQQRHKPAQANEPNIAKLQTENSPVGDKDSKLDIPLEDEAQPLSDQTLKMLEALVQQPDKVRNSLELAEILFLCGYQKQAAVFYQQALKFPKDANDVNSAGDSSWRRREPEQDKAWILFQIGNCLRDEDPTTAKKMYEQLITEFPNCLWVGSAKCQMSLISWLENDKPKKLIEDCKL